MKIEFLFPELVTLYGEKANVEYLKKSLPGAQLVTTSLGEGPAFAIPFTNASTGNISSSKFSATIPAPDFCYIGSMEEEFFEPALSALRPYKKALERYIDSGRIFLATGNAIDLFGTKIEWKNRVYPDGHVADCVLEGLGLFDMTSVIRRDQSRHNSWFYGEFEDIKIMGHRSTFSRQFMTSQSAQADDSAEAQSIAEEFIHTLGGFGMNDETKQEGVRRGGFYGTTLLGPLLIMNPPLTKYFIRQMEQTSGETAPETLFEEKMAMEAYQNRLAYLSKPDARYIMGALG